MSLQIGNRAISITRVEAIDDPQMFINGTAKLVFEHRPLMHPPRHRDIVLQPHMGDQDRPVPQSFDEAAMHVPVELQEFVLHRFSQFGA